ncbi:MAG: hypothetical protein GY679_01735 [Mycoplasma sp.]|nr:hypothetical protein [Mycoplasma sp.]
MRKLIGKYKGYLDDTNNKLNSGISEDWNIQRDRAHLLRLFIDDLEEANNKNNGIMFF